jgi:hypothetical protein
MSEEVSVDSLGTAAVEEVSVEKNLCCCNLKCNGDYFSLWEAVTKSDFDIGGFYEFCAKMKTNEKRKIFYDAMTAQNIDLGDYNEYEKRLSNCMKEELERLREKERLAKEKAEVLRLAEEENSYFKK